MKKRGNKCEGKIIKKRGEGKSMRERRTRKRVDL